MDILSIKVDSVSMQEAVNIVNSYIAEGTNHIVATANAEMIMLAQSDVELLQILQNAHLVVPDGAGVVWAGRYLGNKVSERVAGYDLAQELLVQAAQQGYRVYFFGGSPGVADKAAKIALTKYSGLKIVGVQHGYFTAEDEPELIAKMHKAKPDILFAALGVPKQEKWLYKRMPELQIPVVMGVGGTFDVMAGVMKRAPLWMQKARLEWLYRLWRQPTRFFRMLALPRFVIAVRRAKKN